MMKSTLKRTIFWNRIGDVAKNMDVKVDYARALYKKYIKDTEFQESVMRKVKGRGPHGVIELNNNGVSILNIAKTLEYKGKKPAFIGELLETQYHKRGNFTELEKIAQHMETITATTPMEDILETPKRNITEQAATHNNHYPNNYGEFGVLLAERMNDLLRLQKEETDAFYELICNIRELNDRLAVLTKEEDKPSFLKRLVGKFSK